MFSLEKEDEGSLNPTRVHKACLGRKRSSKILSDEDWKKMDENEANAIRFKPGWWGNSQHPISADSRADLE